ncbi:thiamine pyrophosphate-binding protein [Tardiphaga robiniae]|uniref:Thiamine pyrophosphate-binding protein n=1 Tax=Tardiphaga robiniae TaxID=943830 RepID=A0A7G6U1L3_9BRAD|nr:thiamine pyrophosphate-binding protein [Tardiphaga robiniae]QND72895.1 thiamine pyrophosphate-binding protein [Tardiphaga robiniae]
MKVYAAIAKALSDLGADTMFGLIGDANLFMVDSYIRDCGGKYVGSAHEASCVLMALGYAQVTGKVGVATVTHGPGLTNTLTALIDGTKSSYAMVLLSGDTPAIERDHFQKVSQRELVLATGAGFEQLRTPETLGQDLAMAFRRARVERRPIVFNMPVEFQWQDMEYRKPSYALAEDRAVVPTSPDLDNAIGIIASARRPLILAGRGAMEPEARAAIIRLARRIEAPLATSLRAKGLFSGEPNNIGICGGMSTDLGIETIMSSDCILAFGASLNRYTTGNGSLLKRKRIIQVNLERAEVGKNVEPDAGLVGDPGLTADAIVRWLDEAEIPSSGFCDEALRQKIADWKKPRSVAGTSRAGTVDIRLALNELDEEIPADRLLATDGGRFVGYAWEVFDVQHPRSFMTPLGVGAIGCGLSFGIGVAAAGGGRPTVMVTGDGGFMLGGLTELHSAVRAKMDLIIVVCNDGSYGAEHIQYVNKGVDPSLSIFDWPDFAVVAQAMGCAAVTVANFEDLAAAREAIRGRDVTKPLLIDIKLDPEAIPIRW